uniref:ATP citrate synthase n=1 Tax=Macrostomum lignano TaxID=282301 RepID=A0A1I8FK76_9PLAT
MQVQFGHAGACANSGQETGLGQECRSGPPRALTLPASFDQFGRDNSVRLRRSGRARRHCAEGGAGAPDGAHGLQLARELGLIRKPSSFMTSICDERGQELLYAGVPITEIINRDFGHWRRPVSGCVCLQVYRDAASSSQRITAPRSQALTTTIVCARAGKDLVSCLTSGLLTIGDRFGGALDGARSSSATSGHGPHPYGMRKRGELIMGIGASEIRSGKNFPASPMLHYALEVEKITTSKKPNLILNVDGMIGVAMVDLLRHCGWFHSEADEFIEIGALNGMFVLGRSMGFIGHYLDQRSSNRASTGTLGTTSAIVMPEQSQWAP